MARAMKKRFDTKDIKLHDLLLLLKIDIQDDMTGGNFQTPEVSDFFNKKYMLE